MVKRYLSIEARYRSVAGGVSLSRSLHDLRYASVSPLRPVWVKSVKEREGQIAWRFT